MLDKPSTLPCDSVDPPKLSNGERAFGPSAPSPHPPALTVPQKETANPETAAPMNPESQSASVLPPVNAPVVEDYQAYAPKSFENPHQHPMPPPFFPQNGPYFRRTPAPMEPSAVYPKPVMPPVGFYPTFMPIPYGGYHPHHPGYPSFANGFPTQQHFTGTNGHQPNFNSAYQSPADIPSMPAVTENRMARPLPFPASTNSLYTEVDSQPRLPSFRCLENATRRPISEDQSHVAKRCRSPLSNSPSEKRRRLTSSKPGSSQIQAKGVHGYGRLGPEKETLIKQTNEKQPCLANASSGSPSNLDRSAEVANTGSTPKSTAQISTKSGGHISIRDIVHPSETLSPFPAQTQTDQSQGAMPDRDVPIVGSQNVPTTPCHETPVSDIPPHFMGMVNPGYDYFCNPHHDPFRHYPNISKLFWRPRHPQDHPQGNGNFLPGQKSNMMGMNTHHLARHQSYATQRLYPVPLQYPYGPINTNIQADKEHHLEGSRSINTKPHANKEEHGHGSRPSVPTPPIRQHPVHIAPAPSASSNDIPESNSVSEYRPQAMDMPERVYDLAAIEKLGCKVLKWRVYNEQNHPVCAAPRENGVPCRRNVSRSPCKWHGLAVPLHPSNTVNGRLDTCGNLMKSFNPPREGPDAGPSQNSNVRASHRARAPRGARTADSKSKVQRWTDEEHFLFLLGYRHFGKSWSKIAKVVRSRTTLQTQSHGQKFFERRRKQEKKKSTIHDLVFESPEMQAIYNNTPKNVIDRYLDRAFARENPEEYSQGQEQEQPSSPDSDE